MKRPIAMRCNQEQFDSIKDKLIIPNEINSITHDYCWLVSERRILEKGVQIYSGVSDYYEIHETFNADIFLEACGVEVEKVWKGNELQFKSTDGNWIDCTLKDYEFRLKPKPDYTAEIAELENKIKELKAKML